VPALASSARRARYAEPACPVPVLAIGGLNDRLHLQARARGRQPPELPVLHNTVVPNWSVGDTIPLGQRTLKVVAIREEDPASNPVLVVAEAS